MPKCRSSVSLESGHRTHVQWRPRRVDLGVRARRFGADFGLCKNDTVFHELCGHACYPLIKTAIGAKHYTQQKVQDDQCSYPFPDEPLKSRRTACRSRWDECKFVVPCWPKREGTRTSVKQHQPVSL